VGGSRDFLSCLLFFLEKVHAAKKSCGKAASAAGFKV